MKLSLLCHVMPIATPLQNVKASQKDNLSFVLFLYSELILNMLDICYSLDEDMKSLQTQAYIHFVDFLDMCASTAKFNLINE